MGTQKNSERVNRFIEAFEKLYGRKPRPEDTERSFMLQVSHDLEMSVGGARYYIRAATEGNASPRVGAVHALPPVLRSARLSLEQHRWNNCHFRFRRASARRDHKKLGPGKFVPETILPNCFATLIILFAVLWLMPNSSFIHLVKKAVSTFFLSPRSDHCRWR